MTNLRFLALKADRGDAVIEFGLIAVFFIITLLSVVEMGRMVLVYTTVANAARTGARYAIVHGADRPTSGVSAANQASGPGNTTQVKTVVQNFASAGLLNTSRLVISVTYPSGTNTPGSPVSVTVSYPYDPIITYFTSMLSDTLSSTSEGIITF